MSIFPLPSQFKIKRADFNTTNLRDLAGALSQAFTSICSSGACINYLNVNTLNVDFLTVTGANIINLTGNNAFFTNLKVTNLTGNGSGLPAYGYAVGQNNSSTNNGFPIVFDLGGTVYPNLGITPPSAGGTTFTIIQSGIYEFNFYVCAANSSATSVALQIGLFVNGSQASSPNSQGYIFQSALGGINSNTMLCIGQGIISLTSGNTVTLNNISAATINFLTVGSGGISTAGANRTLSLKRIG